MSRAKKRGPGRPKLSLGTARTEVLSFKLSVDERTELEHAAGDAPLTSWARETLLEAARRGRNTDIPRA